MKENPIELSLIFALLICQLPVCAKKVKQPVVNVPVYFATDRKIIGSNKEDGGHELTTMWTGKTEVVLPAQTEWMDSSRQKLADSFSKMGWSLNPTGITQKPFIEARGYVAEYKMKPLCLPKAPSKLDGQLFFTDINAASSQSPHHNVCIYIPGFASSGDNTLYASGILSANLQAPVIAFMWPSEGTVGLRPPTLIGDNSPAARFARDKEMIDHPQVLGDLKGIVSELRKSLSPDSKIILVAHSLGNRLLMNYFISNPAETVDSAYFIAADVEESQFEKALPFLKTKSKYNAVFQNPSDLVLKASFMNGITSLNPQRRLGDTSLEVPNIEFVDYSRVAQPNGLKYRWLRHYLPFEQFGSIVRTGEPYNPNGRKPPLVMVRTTKIQPEEKFKR